MHKLFRQFSFPGGIPSHVAPETPGSIHEGGELGYALSHAYGAALDNPDLLVACVIGDGEAETGPLAASWHANKFLDPATDGAVLPILHLNGWKIANPTVLARIGDDELGDLLRGYGHRPIFVTGDDPALVHQALAAAMDDAYAEIRRFQREAREHGAASGRAGRRSSCDAEGLDGPEGRRRQAGRGHLARPPGAAGGDAREPGAPGGARALAAELPAGGAVRRRRPPGRGDPRARAVGAKRMGSSPHANGGELLRDLDLPDFRDFGGRGGGARRDDQRGDARARHVSARGHAAQRRRRATSVWSAPTRPSRTGSAPCSRRRGGRGWASGLRSTRGSPRTGA